MSDMAKVMPKKSLENSMLGTVVSKALDVGRYWYLSLISYEF